MRCPFVFRFEADQIEKKRKKLWDDLEIALRRNDELWRRIWSLELENTELRRKLRERGYPERVTAQVRVDAAAALKAVFVIPEKP